MDRRLRCYTFKSLPNAKKKAVEWLRKHPMECVVWASKQASTSRDCDGSSYSSDKTDLESQEEDGILKEEKDPLQTLELIDEECVTETVQDGDKMASSDKDDSHDDYNSEL